MEFAGRYIEAIEANFVDGFFALFLLAAAAFEGIAHTEVKFFHAKRFGNIVVGPKRQAPNPLFFLHGPREEQDGDVGVELADVFGEGEPIFERHFHVEDTAIESARFERCQSFIAAVAHRNSEPLCFEVFLRKRAEGKIVVNKEKVHGGGCLPAEARSAKEGELVYCLPALAFPPAESWRAGAKEGDLGSWRSGDLAPSFALRASAGKLAHKHRQVWWFSDARKQNGPQFLHFFTFFEKMTHANYRYRIDLCT